jgi:flagellar biosynthesis/type III secretory pathway protein FliH
VLDKGEKVGVKQGKKEDLKEGMEKGMNLGHEEGHQVAKEGFDKIIQAVKTKGTLKKTTTHEMAMQTNNDLQWQSTATQTTPTSTVNAVM